MTIRPIVICGEPVLHRPTRPVTEFGTPELDTLIQDMFETNEAAHGAGLAANQIGDDRRMFIYDCPDHGTRRRGYVVNPTIETSPIPTNMPDPDDDSEGCLSVPGENFPTGRADWAKVTGVDPPASRSRWRAPASSPAACSTRSTTWTATCTSTG